MKKLFAIVVCMALLCSMGTVLVGCSNPPAEKDKDKDKAKVKADK